MKNRPIAVAVLASLLLVLTGCTKSNANGSTTADPSASVLTVEIVTPLEQVWPQSIQATGPLAAWQEAIVSPEIGGLRLVELKADVGEHVKRGQMLARLDDASLQVSLRKQEAQAAQARANLSQARSNLERARVAEGSGALSAQRIEEYRITAETSQAALDSALADLDNIKLQLSQTRVLAIDDGIVSSKSAVLGSVVSAGTEMFRLVRRGQVEWRPEFDARQLAVLQPGRLAHITLADGEVVQGEVRLVGPTLSTSTARAVAYVTLPRESGAKPGMFASGTIELEAKPALTVPATAVVLRDGRAYAYLLDGADKVTSRPIVAGRRRNDRVEVVSGLPSGARVVARGGAFLSDGVRVTVENAQAPASAASRNQGSRQ